MCTARNQYNPGSSTADVHYLKSNSLSIVGHSHQLWIVLIAGIDLRRNLFTDAVYTCI